VRVNGARRIADALRRYTFIGFIKWLWLGLRGRRVIAAGECLLCGRCCHRVNLTGENDRWISSSREFKRQAARRPDYARFRLEGATITGLMTFCCECAREDGACGDYENRPDFCRVFPEPELFFMGAELLDGCGYRFEVVPSFKRMLERQIKSDEKGDSD
jgi:uncharacterized protein